MTLLVPIEATCAVCRQVSEHTGMMSTNCFGSPDLDLRPAEMQRSTMSIWVQCCPHCSYVSDDIGSEIDQPVSVRRVMSSPRWQELTNGWQGPDLTSVFLRYALINRELGKVRQASAATLHAAWAADDEGDIACALACRLEAVALTKTLLKSAELDEQTQLTTCVQLVDMLRRADCWAEAEVLCAELRGKSIEPTIDAVLRFEAELIRRRDAQCHTVADATPQA